LDKYEEEDEMELENGMDIDGKINKKNSHIYFKYFNEVKNYKDWHYQLKNDENVECLAQGTGWIAAFTDYGYIRVFSVEGIQKYLFS